MMIAAFKPLCSIEPVSAAQEKISGRAALANSYRFAFAAAKRAPVLV